LWGIEVEGRKAIDFLGVDVLEYLSLGGNFTYIDAEVGRSAAELARSQAFFGSNGSDRAAFAGLARKRRLFGQPEWIANADISFDHDEWGTKVTLAFFAISDVLDAAGSASISPSGEVISATLDRYIDSFHQLDLVFSQELFAGLSFKVSVKNLTDSTRRIVYDRNQTVNRIAEREYKVGRDYSFSLKYEF